MLSPWHLAALALISIATFSTSTEINHEEKLVEWLRSKGGFVSDKIEIRSAADNDPAARSSGIFANSDLAKDELIISVPPECIIRSVSPKKEVPFVTGDRVEGNYRNKGEWYLGEVLSHHSDGTLDIRYDDGDFEARINPSRVRDIQPETYAAMLDCFTARNLIKEMRLGDESQFAPYVRYLLEQESGQLPSSWSDPAKKLFSEILGDGDEDILPPSHSLTWISDDWRGLCHGSVDPFEENAALLVVQRGWGDVLVPVYDMMNHRNGRWLNTKSNSVREVYTGANVEVRASREVKAGEELFATFNFCEDCGARLESYGTPELFRDYGFIEQFPQRWIFDKEEGVAFTLDESDSGDLELAWFNGAPTSGGIQFLQEHLQRLRYFGETQLASKPDSVLETEWEVISKFHQTTMTAMRIAIQDVNGGSDACASGRACPPASLSRYDSLGWQEDDLDYSMHACDTIVSLIAPGHDTIETVQSPYQKISFIKDPTNNDVCFDLDSVMQMCGSYRPHYHEMVVHYTARFLKDVKRVLWVGGGDSMLLHEIIKYPNLEKVVGLELDQVVTRHSFKHFGTQPHWDNDKVEWWYGDATKSLLMLPEEYFGSFDMVLVDLSETVMSFLVTAELDVMEALSLLLKPEGVFVKNEHYLDKMSQIFDYTIQIHYNDTPVICSQALIMGSNKLDFLKRNLTDHGVESLFLPPFDSSKDKFEIFHDYRKNDTSVQKHCKNSIEPETEPDVQERSPGIIMIVEAENASAMVQAPKKFKDIVETALRKAGLSVKSSTVSEEQGGIVFTMLQEGYVVARMWPEHKYCAFDVHLWSSYHRHDNAKKSLLDAVGSTSSSSFRIVAGGMFNVDTWKEDEKSRGPRITQLCDRPPAVARDAEFDQKQLDAVLDESMAFAQDSSSFVAVLCGLEKNGCHSLDALQKSTNVGDVMALRTCSELEGNEYVEGVSKHMFECEKVVLEAMRASVAKTDKQLRAIVVDTGASRAITQIVHRILCSDFNRNELLTSDVLVVAPMIDPDEDWRRNFLERFRKDIIKVEPVFRTEVKFNSTESSIELGLTSSGDNHFFQHLVGVTERVEKRTGLQSEPLIVAGGLWAYQDNFVPSQFFLPGDYDRSGPLEQFTKQQPLGHQSIFQLEDQGEDAKIRCADVKNNLSRALQGMISEGIAHMHVDEFADAGDGCVLLALWTGGCAVVLWDGKRHIDVNLFTYLESVDVASAFVDAFKAKNPSLKIVLRDEQPRGFGRVVNFLNDIEPRANPHWAL